MEERKRLDHIMAAGQTHIVYMNGNKICPVCAGTMATIPGMDLAYRCIDCRTRFEIVDLASEKEMILKEVS